MVASHHHLSVKDDVETEDDRPDDGKHQPHCSSLKEQSPIYLRFRCFESSFWNAKFRCFEGSFQNVKIGSHLWEKQSDKACEAEDNEDAEQCAWNTINAMMTWWRRKICKMTLDTFLHCCSFLSATTIRPHLPRQWSLSWSAWRRGWGRRPPRQSCPRQWAPPPLGRWSKLHLRIKLLRRVSHKQTPSYLSANPRREWTVQERSCCGESSFWWRARTPGRSWGWGRRPWPHRAEKGSPWRTWPHLGWRRTQWSP